jgi:uncharacterized membrane protein
MNADTFDGSQPILVSYDTIRDIEDRLNVPFDGDENRVLDGLGHFYNEYVLPNMFPIIVISILFIYLLIKYILKQDREEREEQEKKDRDKEKARNRRAKRIYRSMTSEDYPDEVEPPRHDPYPNPGDGESVYNRSSDSQNSRPPSDHHSEDRNSISAAAPSTDNDIADYISDDYLLTDTDEQSKSDIDASNPRHPDNPMHPNNPINPMSIPQISEANPMMSDMIAIHQGGLSTPFSTQAENTYKSRDEASKLIFGQ